MVRLHKTAPPLTVHACRELFALTLEAQGRSPETRRVYDAALRRFAEAAGDPPLAAIDAETVERYLHTLRQTGLAPRSLRTYHAALSAFLRWAQTRGLVREVVTAAVPRTTLPKSLPRGFTVSELRLLLAACDQRSPQGARDRAIILTLYATGLRVGELVALTKADLEHGGALRIHGKGDKERLVALQADALGAIEHYLLLRGADAEPALWLGHRGPMTTSGIWYALRRVGARAGVADVHPHRFRNTALAAMLAAGMGEAAVMQIAGHSSLSMLVHYVAWANAVRANDALLASDFVRATLGPQETRSAPNLRPHLRRTVQKTSGRIQRH